MGRHPVVGLAVPGREMQHRKIGREKRQRTGELLQARSVAAHDRKTYGGRPWPRRDRTRQIRNDKTFGAFGDIGEGQRAPGMSNCAGDWLGCFIRPCSPGRNALMRSNSGPAYCEASSASPDSAA